MPTLLSSLRFECFSRSAAFRLMEAALPTSLSRPSHPWFRPFLALTGTLSVRFEPFEAGVPGRPRSCGTAVSLSQPFDSQPFVATLLRVQGVTASSSCNCFSFFLGRPSIS
jgi:hypothetical protein